MDHGTSRGLARRRPLFLLNASIVVHTALTESVRQGPENDVLAENSPLQPLSARLQQEGPPSTGISFLCSLLYQIVWYSSLILTKILRS